MDARLGEPLLAGLRHLGFEARGIEAPQDEREAHGLIVLASPVKADAAASWVRCASREIAWFLGAGEVAGARRLLATLAFCPVRELACFPDARAPSEWHAPGGLPRPTPAARRRGLPLCAWDDWGLGRWMAPARVLFARRAGALEVTTARVERACNEIARALADATAEVEHVSVSCGGTLELHTRARDGTTSIADPGAGRWTVQIATRPEHVRAFATDFEVQRLARACAPRAPIPAMRAHGVFAGLHACVEARSEAWPADRTALSQSECERLLESTCEDLAALVVDRAAALQARELEEQLARWQRDADRTPHTPLGRAILARAAVAARKALVGRPLPRVVAHGDLRPRHVLLDRSRRVAGYVHWSLGSARGWPLLDAVHLAAHLDARTRGESLGASWARRRDALARGGQEARPFARYAERIGLEPEAARALVEVWPLALAAVAGAFSETPAPRDWLERAFRTT